MDEKTIIEQLTKKYDLLKADREVLTEALRLFAKKIENDSKTFQAIHKERWKKLKKQQGLNDGI